MDERIPDKLDTCLEVMRSGVKLDECLRLYPDLANDLRPALEAYQAVNCLAFTPVPAAAFQRSRHKYYQHAAEFASTWSVLRSWFGFSRLAWALLAVMLVFFLSWKGLVVVSAKAIPGDNLYPFKRAAEQVNLRFAPNAQIQQATEVRYALKRAEEVQALFLLDRQETISLDGVLSEQSAEHWIVAGIPVVVTAVTKLEGAIVPGSLVEVLGITRPSGWVEAQAVYLRAYAFAGEVEAIHPGSWDISGRVFHLNSASQVDPRPRIGDRVLVLVHVDDNQRLTAQAIVFLPPVRLQAAGKVNEPVMAPVVFTWTGEVEQIAADFWLVSGRRVRVNQQTAFEGTLTTGEDVQVQSWFDADGSLIASRIVSMSEGNAAQDDDQATEYTGSKDHSADEAASKKTSSSSTKNVESASHESNSGYVEDNQQDSHNYTQGDSSPEKNKEDSEHSTGRSSEDGAED